MQYDIGVVVVFFFFVFFTRSRDSRRSRFIYYPSLSLSLSNYLGGGGGEMYYFRMRRSSITRRIPEVTIVRSTGFRPTNRP